MKILVTAFEPFGGETINPAQQALNALPPHLEQFELHKLSLPVVFGTAVQRTISALDALQPQACVSLGEAGGRFSITVERVAINIDDGRIADNAGHQPVDVPIDPHGPAAYFSTLPIKAIVEAMQKQGIPAAVSNSAGTYLCNHLMYGVLHHIACRGLHIPAGFIHLPYLPQQVIGKPGTAHMSLETSTQAIEIALRVILSNV